MNDNWIEEKAREVLVEDLFFKLPLADYELAVSNVAAALREAENRGLEKAAEVAERWKLVCKSYGERADEGEGYKYEMQTCDDVASHIRELKAEALKTGEGR